MCWCNPVATFPACPLVSLVMKRWWWNLEQRWEVLTSDHLLQLRGLVSVTFVNEMNFFQTLGDLTWPCVCLSDLPWIRLSGVSRQQNVCTRCPDCTQIDWDRKKCSVVGDNCHSEYFAVDSYSTLLFCPRLCWSAEPSGKSSLAEGLCTVSDFSVRGNWESKPF